ncbi:hypothetical protein ACFL26_02135 [Patescibacteria group bacterium]
MIELLLVGVLCTLAGAGIATGIHRGRAKRLRTADRPPALPAGPTYRTAELPTQAMVSVGEAQGLTPREAKRRNKGLLAEFRELKGLTADAVMQKKQQLADAMDVDFLIREMLNSGSVTPEGVGVLSIRSNPNDRIPLLHALQDPYPPGCWLKKGWRCSRADNIIRILRVRKFMDVETARAVWKARTVSPAAHDAAVYYMNATYKEDPALAAIM